jgi:hypothetical protein
VFCSQCRAAKSVAEITRTPSAVGSVEYACATCATVLETTYVCGPCGGEKSAVTALNKSGQIVRQCPTCESPMGLALSRPTAATGKAVGGEVDERERPTEYIVPGEFVARGAVATAPNPRPTLATLAARSPLPSARTGADIETDIRARVTVLETEIAARKGLEAEAKTLRKILANFDRARASASARISVTALMAARPETQN